MEESGGVGGGEKVLAPVRWVREHDENLARDLRISTRSARNGKKAERTWEIRTSTLVDNSRSSSTRATTKAASVRIDRQTGVQSYAARRGRRKATVSQ